jgi:hypothetical protein
VDLVLVQWRTVAAVEVKAAATVGDADFRGLRKLRMQPDRPLPLVSFCMTVAPRSGSATVSFAVRYDRFGSRYDASPLRINRRRDRVVSAERQRTKAGVLPSFRACSKTIERAAQAHELSLFFS